MACNPRMGNPEVAERLVLGEHRVCEIGAVAITEGDRTSGAAPAVIPRRSMPNIRVRFADGVQWWRQADYLFCRLRAGRRRGC
jgi:hypothetical protein